MQADDSSRLSASPDMHCVWLCSHRLLRGGGRVGAHTLYAYWGFVHTLAVSWDIPPSGIVIGVTSILEVCLMRSQPCADLLYEVSRRNDGVCVRSWFERKRREPMQRVNLDGVDLEYDVQGSGEP